MTDEWLTAPPRVMGAVEKKVIEEIRAKYLDDLPDDDDYRQLVKQVTEDTLSAWERHIQKRGVEYAITRKDLGGGWAAPLGRRR